MKKVGKQDKQFEKMRANHNNWRIDQIEVIAKRYNVVVRKTKGSHVILSHPEWIELLSIPAHRPIKPIYIKKFVQLIGLLKG